jgi:putative ABC transport system permease protein
MTFEWYDQIQRDVRLAGRRAVRHATLTVVLIVCLSLGFGAVISALSVLHHVVLSPLPFEGADRLVQVGAYNLNRSDPDERYFVSWYPIDVLLRERGLLEGVAAFYQRDFDLLTDDEALRVPGAETVAGSFDVLGVQPLLGRTLEESDVRVGRRVAVIGETLWSRHYARDPSVLGRTIQLEDEAYEIVGVVPGDLRLTSRAEVFPVYQPDDYSYREHLGMGVFLTIGRLPAGAAPEAVQRDLDAMLRALLEAEPIFFRDYGFEALGLREALVGDFRTPLWALAASAVFVLLLAAANVANLIMARAQGETWERGLRTALGARCRRLAQQGLVENLFLTGGGALVGIVMGHIGVRVLVGRANLSSPAFEDAGLTLPVVLVALALAGSLAAIMSLLPAMRCYNALDAVRRGRDGRGARAERRVQTAFVVGQLALSFVLLVGAGLTWRSVANLRGLDIGFDTEPLVVARVSAPASLAGSVGARADFTGEVLARVRALAGVEAAGAVSWVPFDDADVGFNYSVEESPPEVSGERYVEPGRIVAPGYFASMGIPLLAGRDFADTDGMDAPPVAIVSRAFERRFWPAGSALGKRIKRGAYNLERPWIEIVGVVGDVRSGVLSDPIKPAMFYPQRQTEGAYLAEMAYTVRLTEGVDVEEVVGGIRTAVPEVSASATVFGVTTGAEIRRVALGRPRFNSSVIGIFAGTGLLLAVAGVFGVTSYGVSRRKHELGVRVVLGAGPRQVGALVLRRALLTAVLGLGVGIVGALAVTAGLTEMLFQTGPRDYLTYATVAALLCASTLLASYVPARRATRVDPNLALKSE